MTSNGFFEGTEPGTELTQQPVGAVFFGFPKAVISLLLARSDAFGPAKGVRLHLNGPRSANPTELYAAACGISKDILDSNTTIKQDYFLSNGSTVSKAGLPTFLQTKTTVNTCVYFSKNLLTTQMSQAGVTMIRFYVVPFGTVAAGQLPNFTLVSVGVNNSGNTVGTFRQSEEPCPPMCPTEYP